VGLLQSMTASRQLKAAFTTTPVMEQLAIGIKPSSYDNGYNPGLDRPNLLGDHRVRQAIALCLDRQKVVDTVLFGLSSVPDTYVPVEDPLYNTGVTTYAFNVEAGRQLLEQAGWRQVGDDPTAPRQAYGVTGVPDGTPLVLNYATTDATQRVQVSTTLAASLAQCGIKTDVQYLDAAGLYAPGPQGALFGRAFDLAEFAIRSAGLEPPCEWYTSAEIPNAANHWVGTNISGYSSPAFDAACQSGQQSLPDDSGYADAYHQTEAIFSEDLPVIPLYWRVQVAASRKDLCNYVLDPTASSSLWNIAALDMGNAGCQ
jgi:peptide/nickel transport system substrate-binding protein